MRNHWFRLYDELADDPKVQGLPAEDFKLWVNLLCLANRNEGRLPSLKALAFGLRISEIDAGSLVDRLLIAGLLDRVKGGSNGWGIAPHGWTQRQYKSDSSTERVKRFRNAQRAVTVTPSEAETEAETETEGKERGSARARTPLPPPAAVDVVAPRIDRRRQEAEAANELYEAILDVCGLDRNCSDGAWKDVGRVVGAFSAKGRDGPFVRRQAAWFAAQHWKGLQGELPSPKDLLDTAVQFERGVKRKKADNGFTTRSDRNLANLAEIAEHFGLSEISGNGGGDHEGGHLLGPGDSVEVGAVGDGLGLGRGHRQADGPD